ncbi:MAG: 2-amino-4-hydroxy-6-hydroxymethyldihydropteridine diphosphokinase [Deltaproteobacteria bacterium]|nr:MAG: 2-amino-4-hydroxy-6-hydroxymethyldihydropteridine diphosphokinase [Deltaproteobacteria bacterium]
MDEVAFIGFGSNLGQKRSNCLRGLKALKAHPQIELISLSSLYRTDPVGFVEQDWFINGVVEIKTSLSPRELLGLLKDIERASGRKETIRWGPRVLDLDLLLYGRRVIGEDYLQVPHPRMHERAFVLVPLVEIAPEAYHPCLGRTARELLEALGEVVGVEPFGRIRWEEVDAP